MCIVIAVIAGFRIIIGIGIFRQLLIRSLVCFFFGVSVFAGRYLYRIVVFAQRTAADVTRCDFVIGVVYKLGILRFVVNVFLEKIRAFVRTVQEPDLLYKPVVIGQFVKRRNLKSFKEIIGRTE